MTSDVEFSLSIDRSAIYEITPMDLGGRTPSDFWACTRCGRSFRVWDSYAVHFDSRGRRLQFVVCPNCARELDVPVNISR